MASDPWVAKLVSFTALAFRGAITHSCHLFQQEVFELEQNTAMLENAWHMLVPCWMCRKQMACTCSVMTSRSPLAVSCEHCSGINPCTDPQ